MKVAIIGPAGSGKSTLANILRAAGKEVLDVDNYVLNLYDRKKVLNWLIDNGYSDVIDKGKYSSINKDLLATKLLNNGSFKIRFEDFLFSCLKADYFESDIEYFDGVLPRFADYFDQVIWVEQHESDRRSNLSISRKVPIKRIIQIERLQEDYISIFNHREKIK